MNSINIALDSGILTITDTIKSELN